MASTYLTRTFGTATSRTTGTFSFWIKSSNTVGGLINNYSSNTDRSVLYFGSDYIRFYDGAYSIEYNADIGKIRDCSAWYHIVLVINTPDGTQQDRVKIYINGVRQSPLIGSPNYSQSQNSFMFNPGSSFFIGKDRYVGGGGDNYLRGSISHLHYCDGQAYDASYFGETDATTGEWKIKTDPSVTYGSQGFFILKDGNSITDSSSNSNNFTVGGGTLTKTEDNPSNNFCTMNPLDNHFASSTFSHGNNTVQTSTSNYTWNTGTLGMTSGKFYWEVKYSANSNSDYYNLIGIADRPTDDVHDVLGRQTNCSNYGYYSHDGGVYAKATSINSYGNSYTVGDIVGVAVDLDNNKLYFSKNGTWQNSGVPTSGSTGTGAFSIDAISSTTTGVYFPASGDYGSSQNATNQHNFGNGYFGTTAVSSAGTNASGIGIFEYDVPTGYTALSTKGLNL